ncbi:phospho-sugar mutase [Prevotella amnii]|jgi:phosphoglucomutase/phosphomannomutase, alpha/beta/alpha domain II|uniref:Phosphoglucomutase n=2 Tax=Prevotella amnii TaxID=419005 RepID=A0A096B2C9_9BACT|nr:phospho-sugar mutase [Prevotella amnii]EFN90877.1 phosphoglucomutase/phosphomannomutase, alpha/beta/alpha domain II [Prevotella amnii CRIS 21A-A]KGF53116.1 phosphoglucomutase [Prevotella amnii DNF00058]
MAKDLKLIEQCEDKAKSWMSPSFDEETRLAVKKMIEAKDKSCLIDSFYKDLEFGTGGLRGIMGAGSNRMNIYTVGMATQGFANYLKRNFKEREQISVVVCHDCRNNSRLFAETVANIFSANGIKVFLFEDLRPTPECSFAIRNLRAQAGVNITASHNPREYNGYKAYWEDGAQVLAPHDKGIIEEVNKVRVEDVKFEGKKELIQIIGEDIDKLFLDAVKTVSIDPSVIKNQHDLKIVYTPLHGAGRVMIPRALRSWGFDNIHCVEEQMVKDGNFPTVDRPNPEIAEALTLGLRDAKKIDADILMASDPDADRVGMACKNSNGEWVLINGNQTCLIFLWYILTNRKAMGLLKPTDFIVKTIVTTEVIRKIAEKQHVEMRDCYTGFKWIAREVALSEGKQDYIGGGEESYGFMAESFCRDKDAVSACCLLAEICAYAKDHGKTLYDIVMDIYMEYGFSYEYTINVERPGKTGADEIQQMMQNFRTKAPKELGGSKIAIWKDYQTLEAIKADGTKEKIDMPETSNVLQWFCEDGNKVSVRPSGTEPKIKFYLEIKENMTSPNDYNNCVSHAKEKIEAIKKSLNLN